MGSPVIRVENVSKVYQIYDRPLDRLMESLSPSRKARHKKFYALKQISLEIQQGSFVGIIGKNGSGKSTLLKLITGVSTPTEGNIIINGKISALLELGAGFNVELTGLENIYLHGTLTGFTKEQMDAKLDAILQFADIGDFIHQPVKSYSSGMFARLAFSVSINIEPDILIVDEALAVGDIAFQAKCYRKFNEFRDAGKTILFVTHSLDTVIRYCDHVILLNEGHKVAEGNAREMVDVFKKIMVNQYEELAQDTFADPELADSREQPANADNAPWKLSFETNPHLTEYGLRSAEIIDYGIFDERGKPSPTIFSGDTVVIKMRVKFHQHIANPIFAFTIKDVKGMEIAGTNNLYENISWPEATTGQIVEASFTQALPLQAGNYTLSLGCTGFEQDQLVVYHRLYDVLLFNVALHKHISGIIDLNSAVRLSSLTPNEG